jgi:excisionase family DNA binding protein
MVETEKWLTRKEAAAVLNVHVRTLDKIVRKGVLQRYHLAGTRRAQFRIEDVRGLRVPNGEPK